jgi:hypothetical protein
VSRRCLNSWCSLSSGLSVRFRPKWVFDFTEIRKRATGAAMGVAFSGLPPTRSILLPVGMWAQTVRILAPTLVLPPPPPWRWGRWANN